MLLGVVVSLVACDDGSRTPAGEYRLTLWNRSQFELLEIRVHRGTSYSGAANVLDAPLAPEAHLELPSFTSGDRVTVIRNKIGVGPRIAYTTNEGVAISAPGYTLVIFDESFRLLDPDSPDNPFGEPAADGAPSGGD